MRKPDRAPCPICGLTPINPVQVPFLNGQNGLSCTNQTLYRYAYALLYFSIGKLPYRSLYDKYKEGYQRILMQNLDYIRCSNPINPELLPEARYAWHDGPSEPGFGQIVPLDQPPTSSFWTPTYSKRGFGRIPHDHKRGPVDRTSDRDCERHPSGAAPSAERHSRAL